MELRTIGAGAPTRAVAAHAVRAGHRVPLSNSRGSESLRAVADASCTSGPLSGKPSLLQH